MNRIISKLHLFSKVAIGSLLLLAMVVVGYAQSKIAIKKDTLVYEAFGGDTNDNLYWNGKRHSCSDTPLNAFAGYDSLYEPGFIITEGSYENIMDDKEYSAIWAIVNDCLYLCDIMMVYDDNTYPTFEDYSKGLMRGLTFDDLFLIRLGPLEELIGRRFKKKFPVGIYKKPLGSGYAIPADWFNGAMNIKSESRHYFAPYQQLIFKAGRAVSVQHLIPDYWEIRKKSLSKEERLLFP